MTNRVEHLAEGVTLYLGDCLEILPTLGVGSCLKGQCRSPVACGGFEYCREKNLWAVVSDPPYGIGHVKGASGKGIHSYGKRNVEGIAGDDRPFNPAPLLGFQEVILWGANHFHDCIPVFGRWLAWNKLGGMEPWDSFSDVEFAWQNKKGADRIFSHLWKGLAQKGAGVKREHPTQKPVELFEWCIEFVEAGTIFDPYMGSGSCGIAAVKQGRQFTGIEIEPKYFDVACRRIADAVARPDLFIEKPKPAKQEAMI